MKTSDTIGTKLLRYFFHIRGVLDENTRQQVNWAISKAFLFMWLYIFVSSGASLLFLRRIDSPQIFMILAYLNLLIGVGGSSFYIQHVAVKLDLDIQEVTANEYHLAVVDTIKGSIFTGILWGGLLFAVWKSVDTHPFPGIFVVVLLVIAVILEALDGINTSLKLSRHSEIFNHLCTCMNPGISVE